MKSSLLAAAFMIASAMSSPLVASESALMDRPDASGKFDHYTANRQPLEASPLVKLPVGAVRPAGWLKKQLQLQADGFHGHLTEISDFLKKDDNAWLSKAGEGKRGWEEPPYWLKGYLITGYLLEDKHMIDEAHTWIEAALTSQKPDGWFGPDKGRTGVATDLKGRDDLWPNMIMLFCLQSYYERTQDPRVIELMRNYFRYLEKVPEDKFLLGFWPSMRGGDQLYSILWLYNRTGESWLLDLAKKTHQHTARWDVIGAPGKELPSWHNVNIAQAFREPAIYWMVSKDEKELNATDLVWRKVRELYGQVPGGMFGADENARPGNNGPRQAIETCGIAEEMLSDEILIAATGNPVWAERCENATFNSLPAAFTADMRGLRYLTAPNLPQSDHTDKAPAFENGGNMLEMNPHSHRCCQHNAGHAWPYFTEHLWYAAPGNGLAAYMYAPCEVTAVVANGVNCRITEKTRYPFEEAIEFDITLPKNAAFPIYLRIPTWCENPSATVNGGKVNFAAHGAGKLLKLEKTWKNNDRIVLNLPMKTEVQTWTNNRGTVSVNRGPLTYSLYIKEQYRRSGGANPWPAFDIFPASPWNYGLIEPQPESFTVVKKAWPTDDQPFRADAAPIVLETKARRIPNWTLDSKGAVHEVVQQPVKSEEPNEPVTLIPMGAARLRISAFPVVSNSPDAHEWPAAK
jgi:hypothetical protein